MNKDLYSMEITKALKEYGQEIERELIKIRRQLHQHPELADEEVWTSDYIGKVLDTIPNIKVYKNLAHGTGVMAVIQGTKNQCDKNPGPCILIRADIDALPVSEDNGLPFASLNNGKMHACGHDAHATWVIGTAMILSKFRDMFSGTVKFVFQPGEEKGYGALEMIEDDSVLENPKVDYAFAAHAWPSIEAGKIGIPKGYAFGSPGNFKCTIKGVGGHGSWPYLAINPITIGSQICVALSQVINEKINSVEPRTISIGSFIAGESGAGNIIPDTCKIAGTFRSTKRETMQKMYEEIENIIKHYCMMYKAEYEYSGYYKDSVINSAELLDVTLKSTKEIIGENNAFIIEEDHLGGENFSEFSTRVKSVYMFVGIKDSKATEEFALHSNKFMLDESVLVKASMVFANIVFNIEKMK